jgi:hypothetical protein
MTASGPSGDGRAPDFLIIGAQKSGTSSITQALRRVPGVFIPQKTEIHYFNQSIAFDAPDSWSQYLAEFAAAPGNARTGEATPDYLSSREAPRRIHERQPTVRLVVSLRNPVDRAYSAYWHAKRIGAISRSVQFEEVLERDVREFGSDWTTIISQGCYSTQLQRYLRYFASEQIKVLLFDDLLQDAPAAMSALLEHIGLETALEQMHSSEPFPHANAAQTWRLPRVTHKLMNRYRHHPQLAPLIRRTLTTPMAPPPMRAETRAQLTDLYRPWNRELEAMLGRSLAAWEA